MHVGEFNRGSRRRWAIALMSFSTLLMIISFQNCGSKMAFQQAVSATNAAAGVTGPTICAPLGGGQPTNAQINNGLLGTLHYLTIAQLSLPNFSQSFPNFSAVYNGALGIYNGNIFLQSVNVPTRYFTSGFEDSSSNELLQSDNTPLVQYFSMKLQSNLVLGQLAPGAYQLATISDDGSILTIKGAINNVGAASDLVISNDGAHSASMACGAQPVQLDATTQLPLELDYYQGPPVSIALMVMYRPVPANGTLDLECKGGQGDSYFFNDNVTPSAEQMPYRNLLSRGWNPLPATNYLLPNNTINPCQ